MKRYIMSLDQGTTSSRCILFDETGAPAGVAQKEFTQYYPRPGWVEHDPMEIWGTQMGVAQEAMQRLGITCEQIAAIGITNQRETTIVWEKSTGKPIAPAIVWQCRRTAELCEKIQENGWTDTIKEKTGLVPDAYFSATKLQWILNHIEGAREKAEAGELLFGTVDTWLIWNLTKGAVHATDYSNASRTMLFNIKEGCWDSEILSLLKIPPAMLPIVLDSDAQFGMTDAMLLGMPIPIHAAIGDQQSALYGHGCTGKGSAKNTFGTGGFLLMNTGESPVISANNLLTTIAWGKNGVLQYALEGSVFIAGAAIQWLRDELKLISDAAQTAEIAEKTADTNGVYVVPSFVGLGAPYWNAAARGTIVGLTRGASKDHLIRATLESLAYQTNDVLTAMQEDSGIILSRLRTDGGGSANAFLMQFLADITNVPVERPEMTELTAYGAARLAGEACGFYPAENLESCEQKPENRVYEPQMGQERRTVLLRGWKRAIRCALYYANQIEEEE